MFAGFTSRWTRPRACAASSAAADLAEDAQRTAERQLALTHEQRLEIAALHVGHRDVQEPSSSPAS